MFDNGITLYSDTSLNTITNFHGRLAYSFELSMLMTHLVVSILHKALH